MKRFITLSISALFAVGAWAEAPLSGEYVDLGLSVKWATCNLGATSSTDAGWYLAWGETSTKTNYTWETYLSDLGGTMTSLEDAGTEKDPLKEYVYGGANYSEGIGGTAYDAATAALGAGYRMPTLEEFAELANTDNCEWVWYDKGNTEFNGVAGYKVTSKKTGYTGNSIFIPAAGARIGEGLNDEGSGGLYWSSTPTPDNACANGLYCISDFVYSDLSGYRFLGLPIRPVYAPVAQIGETAYASLKDALNNAQDGDVVDLVSNAVTEPFTISKDLTLRLNGFKITGNGSNEGYIMIYYGANVTIDGTTAENGMSDIYITADNAAVAIYVDEKSSATIKNVNIVGGSYAAIYCGGDVLIESGNFEGSDNALCVWRGSVVISGGTFSSENDDAIYIDENGSVTIADGYKYQGESESLAAGTYTESIAFAGEVVFDTEKAYAYLVSLIGDKEYANSEYKIYVDETGVLQYTNMAVVAAFPSNKLEVNGNEYLLTNWMLSSKKMKFVVVDGAIAHVYEMVGEEIHLVFKEPASESELVALIGDNVYENAEWVETISVVDGKVAITDKNEVVTILAENNILTKKEDDYTFANISYSYTFIVVDGKVSEIEYHGYGGVVGTYVKKASTPTAIDAIDANKAQKTIKTIENGRVVIIKNGEKYDLAGRKL